MRISFARPVEKHYLNVDTYVPVKIMIRTSWKEKILLSVFGLAVAILLLESGLRLGGKIFFALQEKRNRQSEDPSAVRILCLGESTTALGGDNSYPFQLQGILNQRSRTRFQVINQGMVNKTSTDILLNLADNLDRYRPNLVITMIGINDSLHQIDKKSWDHKLHTFMRRFRSYELLSLAMTHLKYKIWEWRGVDLQQAAQKDTALKELLAKGQPARQANDDLQEVLELLRRGELANARLKAYLSQSQSEADKQKLQRYLNSLGTRQSWLMTRLGRHFITRGNLDQAEKIMLMAVALDTQNYGAYVELGRCYEDMGELTKAVSAYQKAIEVWPQATLARLELARCLDKMGRESEAYALFQYLGQTDPQKFRVNLAVGDWYLDHDLLDQAEEIFLRALKEVPDDYTILESLAKIYDKKGLTQKAEHFSRQAAAMRDEAEHYLPITVTNYNRIAQMILARGIPLICMQYPLRRIQPLQDLFGETDGIVLVENRENFEKALEKEPYAEYFSDSFARTFGHCTDKGNRLIAEQLADVILALPDLNPSGPSPQKRLNSP